MAEHDDPFPSSSVDPDPSCPVSTGNHDSPLNEASFPWVFEHSRVGSIQSEEFASLLPASRRVGRGNLVPPSPSTVLEFLDQATQLDRLSRIHNYLWLAGRPIPPRPLHAQKILTREIFITEDLYMHLVWVDNRIYVKPLPLFLLEPCFWTEVLQCSCETPRYPPPQQCRSGHFCECKVLDRCKAGARGLLFSYVGLVSNKSDYDIAMTNSLFPECLTWPNWRKIAAHVLRDPELYNTIDRRFLYGELRLSRLNKVHFYWYTPGRLFITHRSQYSFFDPNLGYIAGVLAYIVIILTAMQVGLGTDLVNNSAFNSASRGFTIFVLLGLVVSFGLIMITFLFFFYINLVATKAVEKHREMELGNYGATIRGFKD